MGEKCTKADLRHIAEDLIENFRKCLGFIVHKKNTKAQIKCPHCGSANTAQYIYGMPPMFDEKMKKELADGKWVLGGCCVSTAEIDGKNVIINPKRKCNKCKKDFASAPILITPKKDLVQNYRDIVTSIKFSDDGYFVAEDYRDIVTSIKFSIGGHHGYTDITVQKNKDGALVKVQKTLGYEELLGPKQVSMVKWQEIVNKLYYELYLHEWQKEFVDPCVLDGTQWKLDINLTNRRVRHYYGSNDYPPYWKELQNIFREFAKL